ncbi:MAG: metallophosphoesterase family protein [Bacteroidales bacterium]|nr:metallophosphoesterase family protein [Bacteroidales bacterium]
MKKLIPNLILFTVLLLPFSGSMNAQELDHDGNILEVLDQIHFTIISNTAMTFDWTGTADHISYGTDPKNLRNRVDGVHPEFLPVKSPWDSSPGPYWEAKLTELEVNTLYYYRIGNSGRVYEFRTPLEPGMANFKVCITTDMHERSAECVAMFYQVAQLKPDFVISTGDITGAGPGGQQEVESRFRDAMLFSQTAPWMPAWGDHDWEYDDFDDLRTLKGRFDIPNPGTMSDSPKKSCCGEDWGWFDYGNTRFISYPEPYTSKTWTEWKSQVEAIFSEAQKNPDIKFIVSYGHRSSYTSTANRNGGDKRLRTVLDDLRKSNSKYVLDLSGHNHQYERYHIENGLTHIVNSPTGSYYHEGWESPKKPENCAFRVIHYSILVLEFTNNEIRGELLCSVHCMKSGDRDYMPLEDDVCDEPGTVLDSFTITH